MSIVNAKEIMVEAAKGKYAIGAFNITDRSNWKGWSTQ
jgi:fructose/tagatose bisphosphate aldolase